MSGAGFLRIKKLKGNSIIKAAVGHNKRSIPTDDKVDPTRSHLNYALAGPATAGDVAQLAKDLMTAAGLNEIRKDAVRGIELVFSLAPDHQLNERDYFDDCATWAARYYGGVILSVDVHLDEAAPHCHLILLPLVDGRMVGNKLVGYKKELSALQTQFHLDVASRYGLSKAPPKLTGAAKEAAIKAVLQKMRETGDKALQSFMWAVIRDNIESDPVPFLLAYGIELQAPVKKVKSFVDYVVSKGKGRAKEPNTIAFAPPENDRRLSCVAFAKEAPQPPVNEISAAPDQLLTSTPNDDGEIAPPARHALPDVDDSTLLNEIDMAAMEAPFIETITRHRLSEESPDRYDASGDYCPTRPPAPRRHAQAVNGALRGLATRLTANLDRQPSQRFPT